MFSNIDKVFAATQSSIQVKEFELNLDHTTIERTEVFDTSTGHSVIVKTTHGMAFSRIDIEVINDDAYVIALRLIFNDFDHLDSCENCLEEYMSSPALADICEHFDELCTPYDEDEE